MTCNIKLFVQDILECINNIEAHSKSSAFEELKENRLKQSAITRWLEIIGEAAKNIPDDF